MLRQLRSLFQAKVLATSSRTVVSPSVPILVGPSQPPASGGRSPVVVEPTRGPVIRIGPSTSVTAGPAKPVQIQPPPRGAWQERGWILDRSGGSTTYRGEYIVRDRRTGQPLRFQGFIETSRNDFVPYVADPPAGLSSHPKAPCFSFVRDGWYRMHWHRPARNVDDAILYVERILDEIVNGRRR